VCVCIPVGDNAARAKTNTILLNKTVVLK